MNFTYVFKNKKLFRCAFRQICCMLMDFPKLFLIWWISVPCVSDLKHFTANMKKETVNRFLPFLISVRNNLWKLKLVTLLEFEIRMFIHNVYYKNLCGILELFLLESICLKRFSLFISILFTVSINNHNIWINFE